MAFTVVRTVVIRTVTRCRIHKQSLLIGAAGNYICLGKKWCRDGFTSSDDNAGDFPGHYQTKMCISHCK
jgi:hypothetical protein